MDNAAKKQSQKLEALGLFAGGIAHDFNNILSVIDAYARLALKEQAAPEEMQKILAAAERGAGLTRRLLAFSRQKVGVAEALDVAEELRQAAALLPPLLGENIRLELALPASPVYVLAGHDDITQIALNLALNARDAMLQGGRLVISLRSAQGRARISFHGRGHCARCPAAYLRSVFHDQACGAGHGAWPFRRARRCVAAGRGDIGT